MASRNDLWTANACYIAMVYVIDVKLGDVAVVIAAIFCHNNVFYHRHFRASFIRPKHWRCEVKNGSNYNTPC